ncbi:MAG: phage portal protein [Phycisphaerales bacterium]
MSYRLDAFSGIGLDEASLRRALDEHRVRVRPTLERLWAYFRNPLEPVGLGETSSRGWYRLAQEAGLPTRVTGRRDSALDDRAAGRREVVIENDIAWRVQTMVDFLFGKPIRVLSTAADEQTRTRVEGALEAVWEASGGIAMLQDVATLGHVYGHVDLHVRVDEDALLSASSRDPEAAARRGVRIEPIDATRGIGVVSRTDYRELDAFVVHVEGEERTEKAEPLTPALSPRGRGRKAARLFGRGGKRGHDERERRRVDVVEVIGRGVRQVYEDEVLIEESRSVLLPETLPIVHVQNMSQPLRYSGLGEVESLIPLQDELNTRLSDRASRVTMQSFRMFLAKGIDGFDRVPVGPGALWQTDNMEASIESFGGDAASPSEESHIREIREAMDKVSGVPPLASGVLRARIGNLSSENALRVTLLGLLAKTERKRVTYGRGIAGVSRVVLEALDAAGIVRTRESERGVRVAWASPLPSDEREEVAAARAKVELGVSEERVLSELGYEATDPAIR